MNVGVAKIEKALGKDIQTIVRELKNGADQVEVFQRFVSSLMGEGLAPKTIRWYVWLLKRLLKTNRVKIDNDVDYFLELPKSRNVKIDRAPTKREVRELILSATSRQLKLLIHLLAVTGLRISEALSLRYEDIVRDDVYPHLKVVSAKSGIVREVPLTRELLEALGDGEGRIFRYASRRAAYNALAYLLERTGKRKRSGRGYDLHPHSFRKFYKTALEEAGVNPLMIEMWMGHVSGVVHAYFKPSRKMILEEWAKAEKALTLFREEEPSYEEVRKIHELEDEVAELKKALSSVLAQLENLRDRLHAEGSFSRPQLARRPHT